MAGIVEIYSAQIRQLEKINYGQLLVLFSRGPIDIFQAFWMLWLVLEQQASSAKITVRRGAEGV